jgi:CubicO group peptidase (beta-lactamase class C family)
MTNPLDHLESHINQVLQDWRVPGMAIGVVKDDEIILNAGYGLRDVEQNLPVTPDTIFGIASVSKAFTTFAMALLVERGQLDWDKPVRAYIPWFRLQDTAASSGITPRDLVCHRSGLPRHDRAWYQSGASREEVVRRLADLPPNKAFRSFYQYQNMMFVTAGFLVEQLTGESWEHFIQREVFNRLHMTRSNFSVDTMQGMENIAMPYGTLKDQTTRIPFANVDALGPAGSINSTTTDMLNWVRLHLNQGTLKGQRLISPSGLAECHRPQMVIQEVFPASLISYPELGPRSYGLGWFLRHYRGRRMVFHSGGIDGYGSFLAMLPEENIGVIILSNLDEGNSPVPVTFEIFDRLMGIEPPNWSQRYQTHEGKAQAATKAGSEKQKALIVPGTKPSHPADEYLGTYTHPGYGTLKIEAVREAQKNGDPFSLAGQFNLIPITLTHVHFDTFEAASPLGEWKRLTFLSDEDGRVSAVRLPAEANVPPMIFNRVAETLAPELLQACTGTYWLEDGQEVLVLLSPESQLSIQLPGQAPLALKAVDKDIYQTIDYPRITVSFSVTTDGQNPSVEILHPDGLFVAVRN